MFQGPVDTVPEDTAVRVLTVCLEALSNVARHGGASAATVSLSASGSLRRVCDNGRGSGDTSRGSGLATMRQRAETQGGTFSVDSQPGGGTTLEWRMPLQSLRAGRHDADPAGAGTLQGSAAVFSSAAVKVLLGRGHGSPHEGTTGPAAQMTDNGSW